jgi:hypothetical protein
MFLAGIQPPKPVETYPKTQAQHLRPLLQSGRPVTRELFETTCDVRGQVVLYSTHPTDLPVSNPSVLLWLNNQMYATADDEKGTYKRFLRLADSLIHAMPSTRREIRQPAPNSVAVSLTFAR